MTNYQKSWFGYFVLFNCLTWVCLLLRLEVKASVITIRGVNYSTEYSTHSLIQKTREHAVGKTAMLNIIAMTVNGQERKLNDASLSVICHKRDLIIHTYLILTSTASIPKLFFAHKLFYLGGLVLNIHSVIIHQTTQYTLMKLFSDLSLEITLLKI